MCYFWGYGPKTTESPFQPSNFWSLWPAAFCSVGNLKFRTLVLSLHTEAGGNFHTSQLSNTKKSSESSFLEGKLSESINK